MFQPLFDLCRRPHRRRSRRCCAGTIRSAAWSRPVEFIPLAEETGLIVPIGEWVMREACRVAPRLARAVRVAVNVSPVQFRSPGLSDRDPAGAGRRGLRAAAAGAGDHRERCSSTNPETTLGVAAQPARLGVRIALDDFGTGYSSLSYLRAFPFDKIKIDRSFIIDLLSSDGATAIIKSITTLAEALGMETTAEGVENAGQLDILREQGCSQIQGFYFSKPVVEAEVQRMLHIEGLEEQRHVG